MTSRSGRAARVSAPVVLVLAMAPPLAYRGAAAEQARTVVQQEAALMPAVSGDARDRADAERQNPRQASAAPVGPSRDPLPGVWLTLNSGTAASLWGAFASAPNDAWLAGVSSTLLHTTDGGSNWVPSAAGIPAGRNLYAIDFSDASSGWTGGTSTVARSTNAGVSWTAWTMPTNYYHYFTDAITPNLAWGVGEFYSTGAGAWCGGIFRFGYTTTLTLYAVGWCPADPYLGISMVDANQGWAVGGGGMIRRIIDGSASPPATVAQASGTTNTLNAVVAIDTATAYAVGDNGTILKTMDGGTTWFPQASGSSAILEGIDCLNATTCLIVGTGGTVLRTTDGATWQAEPSGSAAQLNGVAMVPGTAYADGLGGAALKRGACPPASINPLSAAFPAEGGVGSVAVTAMVGCPWTAASNASWITITAGTTGSGNGTVSYQVAANPGDARGGTMTIAGNNFDVSQAELRWVSINSVSVAEGDAGPVNASFTLTLSAASSQPATVQYATASGTATAPADYTTASGTVTFMPGITSQPVVVTVQGDVIDEPNEYFIVRLSAPTNARLNQDFGSATIVDDDLTTLSAIDASVFEGHSGNRMATFNVGFPAASTLPVTVEWATSDGTAQAPGDYTTGSGTLSFAPGETSKSISVAVVGDTDVEGDETFLLTLANPTNAQLGDAEGVGTILEDEERMTPTALTLTPLSGGVLAAGDTVAVQPSWRNDGSSSTVEVTGTATAGDGGTIVDGAASYGVIATDATASCTAESDCYSLTAAGPRPGSHWDARLTESLSWGGANHDWRLHVGDSFGDLPRSNPFFRFVETLFHKGITGGCGGNNYCPDNVTTREQMAVFALVGKEGTSYSPPVCGTTPVFSDVLLTSPFCKWVEELSRRGVVSGCGSGRYCPTSAVTREQMSVFVLRVLDPALSPPACTTPIFADVPASSPFCRWIEELSRRGVVSGCGGGNYCPGDPVTRGQMGVFIGVTFGLTLYGP